MICFGYRACIRCWKLELGMRHAPASIWSTREFRRINLGDSVNRRVGAISTRLKLNRASFVIGLLWVSASCIFEGCWIISSLACRATLASSIEARNFNWKFSLISIRRIPLFVCVCVFVCILSTSTSTSERILRAWEALKFWPQF